MVDTMIIYYRFKTYKAYKEVMDIIRDNVRKLNHRNSLHFEEDKMITYAFAAYGIEEMYFKQNISYVMYIKLRPKLMVEKGNYNDVLRAYDVPQLYKRFKEFMENLELKHISNLKEWKVSRIDYAIDIIVTQKLIPQYIELFKRGNIPEGLLNGDLSKRYKRATNNLYLQGKKYRINFYDRYTTTLEKQKKNPQKYKDIENRYGVMRFEIQLHKIDIAKKKKSKMISCNSVDEFLNIDVCKKYILRYYDMIVGKGDYHSYGYALAKCKSKQQINMLTLIREEGSIYKAKQQFIGKGDDRRKLSKQFSEIISKIERLGINPVTIKSGDLKNLKSKILYAIEGSNKFQIRRRKINYER